MKKDILGRLAASLMAAACGVAMCSGAMAADLTIGYKAAITSVDPHVAFGPNRNISLHVYEALVRCDDQQHPQPGLAISWTPIDETHWEFKLRPGVKFSDGSDFTAEDVKFSLARAGGGTGPRSYRSYTRGITDVTVSDPLTVIITTDKPTPYLPQNLSTFGMVSATAAKDAEEADFDSGRAAIGTGPYRLDKWERGASVTLLPNAVYWGEKQPWDKVTFRFIPNDSARVSALLAGDLDVIDAVPTNLVQTISANPDFVQETTTTSMLNYLQLDQFRQNPPDLTGPDGEALTANPFQDQRVREAMSLAIDRQAISRDVMKGQSEPAGQLVPAALEGHVEGLNAPEADLEKAKALLVEAGYPRGFRITLHCTSDRYLNDAKVCEAVAQMLSSIGIATTLDALPSAVFLPRSSAGLNGEPAFGFLMLGFAPANGQAAAALAGLVHTHDEKVGIGANNDGRYSNAAVDAAIEGALHTIDAEARGAFVNEAVETSMQDVGIIPIHFVRAVWASRKTLEVTPRTDGATYAMNVHPLAQASN
jgi:peptide/nickel transport system substrate-binding protein